MSRPSVLLALCVLLTASLAVAQQPAVAPEAPPSAAPPPPPPPPAPPNANPVAAICPALAFEPARPQTLWYVDAESAFLVNTAWHFNDRLYRVKEDNTTFQSSRLMLGRRFEGGDSLRLTIRNLTELGNRYEVTAADHSAKSTFTVNWFDLDYVSREYAPAEWWRVQWEAGGRFVFSYAGMETQYTYDHHESTQHFYAGGIHLALNSSVLLGCSGWSLFGRADAGVVFGQNNTTSRYESYPISAEWGTYPGTSQTYRDRSGEVQFDLTLQAGLMKRWQTERCTFGLGFGAQLDVLSRGRFENQGRDFGGSTRLDTSGLVNVGGFLRAEIGF